MLTEVETEARRRLEQACRLMVKHQDCILTLTPAQRHKEGFTEAWIEMVVALRELEKR